MWIWIFITVQLQIFLTVHSWPIDDYSMSDMAHERLRDRALGSQITSQNMIMGTNLPFPTFGYPPPQTTFSCSEVKSPGFYADVEAGCQVIRRCTMDNFMFSFVCPNMTLFNQDSQSCDYWFNVQCPQKQKTFIPQLASDDTHFQMPTATSNSGFYPSQFDMEPSEKLILPVNAQGTSVDTLLNWTGTNGDKGHSVIDQDSFQSGSKRRRRKNRKKIINKIPETSPLQNSVFQSPALDSMSAGVMTWTTPFPKLFKENQLGTDWIPLKEFVN